jgi:lanthanide-dependent methanol dehydrogenase
VLGCADQWPRGLRYALYGILLLGSCRGLAATVDQQQNRYSALDEINASNVGRLALSLDFPTGQPGGHSGAPVVLGNLLFLVTPFPHTVYALDLANPASPVRWQYSPPADNSAASLACCDITTGGASLADGNLFLTTLDGHALSLDAASGAVRWDVTIAQLSNGDSLAPVPPLVADGRVFIGNGGDDFGVRGWVAALDAGTGHVLWQRYSTGPDSDVGIEDGDDRGVKTWPPGAWQQGGGGLAAGLLYDAAAHLLIHGTGHPAPWNAEMRPGSNQWTSGLFARDAATGAVRWFASIDPHDMYAFGAGGSLVAADMPWRGNQRTLLVHPDANCRVYLLDRISGELLSADAFTAIDAKPVSLNATTRDICPGWPGATGGGGTAVAAFSPQTRLVYIPVSRLCMDMEARQVSFMQGLPYTGANLRMKAPARKTRGALIGWDVAAGKPAWTTDEAFPVESGVLATAGGLVFYGTLDGWFKAVDARDGHLLWQFRTSSGIIGQPITFQRADGHQYVAVLAGVGGVAGRVARNDLDVRDATAAHGYANALRDLKPPQDSGGRLYVFGLQ